MNCMRCGRETPGERAFCEDCLLEMEKYPVKPGTVVRLPNRRETVSSKKPVKRRALSPEEQIKQLRKRVKLLTIFLIASIVLIGCMIYPTLEYLKEDHFQVGQNYSSVKSVTETPEIEAEDTN